MRIAIAAGLVVAAAAAGTVVVLSLQDAPAQVPALGGPAFPVPSPEEERVPVEAVQIPVIEEDASSPTADEPVPQPQPPAPRPPESCDARLFVRLADGETGSPVAMEVRLWRLGVPEDERWTEGDLEVATMAVTTTGGFVEGLVPGRYRLSCPGRREGAEDPPEFSVRSGDNDFVGSLSMPRTFRVHLRVYDEEGRPLERAICQNPISSLYSHTRTSPSWASRRCEKLPDGSFRFSEGSGGGIG